MGKYRYILNFYFFVSCFFNFFFHDSSLVYYVYIRFLVYQFRFPSFRMIIVVTLHILFSYFCPSFSMKIIVFMYILFFYSFMLCSSFSLFLNFSIRNVVYLYIIRCSLINVSLQFLLFVFSYLLLYCIGPFGFISFPNFLISLFALDCFVHLRFFHCRRKRATLFGGLMSRV